MKGETHAVAGLLVGVAIAPHDGGVAVLGACAASTLAALAPDWFQLNIPGANNVIKGLVGHRGITHSLLMTGLVWLLAMFTVRSVAVYIAAGWLSHLALDIVSGGIPALWPYSKRITLARMKTGGRLDTLVGGALLALALTLFIGKWGLHILR